MPDYELSQKADQDLTEIYLYSFENFGEDRADKYFLDLDRCLKTLAENPHKGRSADEIGKEVYRYKHARHTIFYVVRPPGILSPVSSIRAWTPNAILGLNKPISLIKTMESQKSNSSIMSDYIFPIFCFLKIP